MNVRRGAAWDRLALRVICALSLAASFTAACAEGITTRYGNVFTSQAESRAQVTFGHHVVARVEAESVSLFRVAPQGPNEYVIIQAWLPGLHCHSEFRLMTLDPDRHVRLSPAFGRCMELAGVQHVEGGVRVTLSSPPIEGVTLHEEAYAWVSGRLVKAR